MADTLRYRLDFVVPDELDITEEHAGIKPPLDPPPRNETLDQLRAALSVDGRWKRSMLAPWRPFDEPQHLIVWVDLARPDEDEAVIRQAVSRIVDTFLPGAWLMEMVKNPP